MPPFTKHNLDYLQTHRPYPRLVLLLGDMLKITAIVSTILLIAIIALAALSNLTTILFLSSRNIISLSSYPLWLSVVPELLGLAIMFLAGGVAFYIYNQMAYSGYRAGVALFGILAVAALMGVLLLLTSRFPHFQLAFRSVESQIQKPMPSSTYFNAAMNECEQKGYYFGWVENYEDDSITLNQWGARKTFLMNQEDGSYNVEVGDKVLLSKTCDQSHCETKIVQFN